MPCKWVRACHSWQLVAASVRLLVPASSNLPAAVLTYSGCWCLQMMHSRVSYRSRGYPLIPCAGVV